ncbi:DUF2867 domain-containing protein [Pseudovibrio sp. WM33]|uniref:DUF2867 domain-containing protein n=1 Tax=Pseudovibrio sp. WM33 TaxID=1735585 RepID=UPI0007AE39A3|nr:DUF2867 domain-containing protein [Pseudovibrio sp. WM33]KZL20015.1 hypothetical protein PsWM33_04582 [Pseudovibrio sp. WM33]
MPEISSLPVPQLVAPREELNFYHVNSLKINAQPTAFEVSCALLSKRSVWLNAAFWLRDQISALAGVTRIKGFGKERPTTPPAAGEYLDFFLVEHIEDRELVLTSRDKHLSVMTTISVDDIAEGTLVRITSSVITHNWFGNLYMLPVGPAHKFISWRMLRSVSRAFYSTN